MTPRSSRGNEVSLSAALRAEWANAPCDTCRFEDRCAARMEACREFAAWLHHGQRGGRGRWPSAEIYQRIFSEVEDET